GPEGLPRGELGLAEVQPGRVRQEPGGLAGPRQQGAHDHLVVGADRGRPVGTTGGVLMVGTGAPDLFAGAVHLGVIAGPDAIAIPEASGGLIEQGGAGPL